MFVGDDGRTNGQSMTFVVRFDLVAAVVVAAVRKNNGLGTPS